MQPIRLLFQDRRGFSPQLRRTSQNSVTMCLQNGEQIPWHGAPRDTIARPGSAWFHLRPWLRNLSQSNDIYLDVNLRGGNRTMPKNTSDLLQRRALPEHRACYGMPEYMGCAPARAGDASPAHRLDNDHRDRTVAREGTKRSARPDEKGGNNGTGTTRPCIKK